MQRHLAWGLPTRAAAHRGHFLDEIVMLLPGGSATFNKTMVSMTEPDDNDEPITLHFADGTTAVTDVLIAADGLKSATRRLMYESAAERLDDPKLLKYQNALWSGQVMYRESYPIEKILEKYPDHPVTERMHFVRPPTLGPSSHC